MQLTRALLLTASMIFTAGNCIAQPANTPPRKKGQLNDFVELSEVLGLCWDAPNKKDGSAITFRFGLDKNGALRGKPLAVGKQLLGDEASQASFTSSVTDLFAKCFPVNVTPQFGARLGNSPLTVSFLADEEQSGIGQMPGRPQLYIRPLPRQVGDGKIRLHTSGDKSANFISFNGRVEEGDLAKIRRMVRLAYLRNPEASVYMALNSHGGRVIETQKIADFLKANGVGTIVVPGAVCESACSDIFFGGFDLSSGKPDRVVYDTARLGVHGASFSDGWVPTDQDWKAIKSHLVPFYDRLAVSKHIQSKMFSTPNSGMYYLTKDEMSSSEITNKTINDWSVDGLTFNDLLSALRPTSVTPSGFDAFSRMPPRVQ